MSSIICPHCGTTNRAGSNFCNWCGTDLLEGDSASQPPASPEQAGRTEQALHSPAEPSHSPGEKPLGSVGEEPPSDENEAEREVGDAEGMVTGVRGLLAPRTIAHVEQNAATDAAQILTQPTVDLGADEVRRLRSMMTEDTLAVADPALGSQSRKPSLRVPWIYWLIGLALGIPALLAGVEPAGTPQRWPGVDAAYAMIQRKPPRSTVLVSWSYDPATAGEMNLVAEPVIRHLLIRGSRLVVMSQLPGGPATARRLIARVQQELSPVQRNAVALDPAQSGQNFYLPGGATTLPLVGQAPTAGVDAAAFGAAPSVAGALAQTPDLALVIAAQAEDVQHWLEQVQPLNGTPVIALTSAAADPILRPYWDSGQLSGLVSGFDGAYSYEALLAGPNVAVSNPILDRQLLGQNWGHVVLLGLILLGNLITLLGLEKRRQS